MVRALAERAYFAACLRVGRLLRSARYSRVRIVREDGVLQVRKHRRFYAPLLIASSRPLVRMLDAGVRVLPQREWQERERELYARLYGASMSIEAGGTLLLPFLAGETLAALLDDPALEESERRKAIALAVVALAELHGTGVTHADAMAENVMVDLDAAVARWFDFETEHDPDRPMAWRRADDVRALLATCVLRTPPDRVAGTLELILDSYADRDVLDLVARSFDPVIQRPLAFHLGQAELSFARFRKLGSLLRTRDSHRTHRPMR